jgi:hypothetical protein
MTYYSTQPHIQHKQKQNASNRRANSISSQSTQAPLPNNELSSKPTNKFNRQSTTSDVSPTRSKHRLPNVKFVTPKVIESPIVSVPNASKTRIKIQPQEEKLFQLLLATVEHFQLNCTLRVAGGWVRDKVLCLLHFLFITQSESLPLQALTLINYLPTEYILIVVDG